MAKKKQPKNLERVDLGVRCLPSIADEITRGAAKDAEKRGITVSRNDFCVSAALAAARKVLAE